MAETITTIEKVQAVLNVLNGKGNPTTLPAGVVPTWAFDVSGVVTLDGSGDPTGLTIEVLAAAVGTCNLTASAAIDATTTLTATAGVTVTAAGPASLVITFGTPVNQ